VQACKSSFYFDIRLFPNLVNHAYSGWWYLPPSSMSGWGTFSGTLIPKLAKAASMIFWASSPSKQYVSPANRRALFLSFL